jgi:alanine dehydrogenase
MTIGVPKEQTGNETRVALVPAHIPSLVKKGYEVLIEKDAGLAAGYTDSEYEEKGAKVVGKLSRHHQASHHHPHGSRGRGSQ